MRQRARGMASSEWGRLQPAGAGVKLYTPRHSPSRYSPRRSRSALRMQPSRKSPPAPRFRRCGDRGARLSLSTCAMPARTISSADRSPATMRRVVLAHATGRRRARRSRARPCAAWPRAQGLRLLSPGARGGELHALGARPQRHRWQSGILSPDRQAHAVPRRLYRRAFRPFARLDRRYDARARPAAANSTWERRSISSARALRLPIRASPVPPAPIVPCFAAAMRRRGFRPYAKEWWHFTLGARTISRQPISIFRCGDAGVVGAACVAAVAARAGRARPRVHSPR